MSPKIPLVSVEREVERDIMNTDVYVKILGHQENQKTLETHLDEVFLYFRDFERRFSRFREESELSQFNQSQGGRVSQDLFSLLETARDYSQETNGVFDPAILPALEMAGYANTHTAPVAGNSLRHSIQELSFDHKKQRVTKPESLKIDLGGIGKGYCVDMVSHKLHHWGYKDFVVDAGGDIYAGGVNQEEAYPFWAFDIENPLRQEQSIATILLSNEAVATSGRNRRAWVKDGISKHHLIDPMTQDSANSDLMTVSVIAPKAATADVWAKTFFILGLSHGLAMAEKKRLPALFVTSKGEQVSSSFWSKKVWQPTSQSFPEGVN